MGIEFEGDSGRRGSSGRVGSELRGSQLCASRIPQPDEALAKPSDQEGMPVRSIEAEDVESGFALCRIDHLADTKQRLIA